MNTTCDGCGTESPWTDTTSWRILNSQCFCETCSAVILGYETQIEFEDHSALGRYPWWKESDLNYHGDRFAGNTR